MKLFNDSNGVSRFNCSVTFVTEIMSPTIFIDFRVKTQQNIKDYNFKALEARVNVCKISQGVFGNFVIRYIMENLKNHSNFEFSCPMRAKTFFFENFPIINDSYLPLYFLRQDLRWVITFVVKGRSNNVKSLSHISSSRVFGGFKPNN